MSLRVDAAEVVRAVSADGVATVVLPVGGGRRRFVAEVVAEAASQRVATCVVLVVGMADLVWLWHRDLTVTLSPQPVGIRAPGRADDLDEAPLLVTTGSEVRHLVADGQLDGALVIVDEPDVLAVNWPHVADALSGFPHIDLLLTGEPDQVLDRVRDDSHVMTETVSRFDRDIGRLIAGLLDGELERRQPQTLWRWASQVLGQPVTNLHHTVERADGVVLDVAAHAIAGVLDRAEHVTGADGLDGVQWRVLQLPDGTITVPASVRALIPAGVLLDVAFVIEVDPGETTSMIRTLTPAGAAARQVHNLLVRLLNGGQVSDHPYRGQVLDVSEAGGRLTVDAVAVPTDRRDDLILPDAIWREIDRNIHGMLNNRELLARLGLGLNRGVLLHGPPGTGKTQLVRTIIAELAGDVTALLLSSSVMRTLLPAAYRLAQQLAPSIVVLEDADLVIGGRHGHEKSALVDFLTSVDGLISDSSGVFTVATTNEVYALDAAAIRSARIDRIIEVPHPPPVGRRRIWQRYLDGLPGTFDLDQLVHATAGASGADIRELVRHAILDTDGQPTTEVLKHLARTSLGTAKRPGQYL